MAETTEDFSGLPRTRAEAEATGAERFYTGEPCKQGHLAPRFASGRKAGRCCECTRILDGPRRDEREGQEDREAYRQRARAPGPVVHDATGAGRELLKADHSTAELIAALKGKIALATNALTEEKLAKTPARDLATAVGILIDKIQLLEGKPTQILSHEHRMALNEIAPKLLEEARRRGMLIELPETKYAEVEEG